MISYIGGKGKIGKWVKEYIPRDIETYVEGFSGMFWVFFNMDLSKYPNLKTVVYNDYNKLNYNLMKCAKNYDVLFEALSHYPCQQLGVVDTPPEYKRMFNQYQKEIFDHNLVITDDNSLEIACKYVYVLCQVFSGFKPETTPFSDYKGKYRCKVLIFMDKLKDEKFRKHFDKITFVENLDFQQVVEKYDTPTTYFYMDPPYWKTENYYSNHDFDANDHIRLANCIKNIKGKFGLSYYDFPELSNWFPKEQYRWEQKDFRKSASTKKQKNVGTELLIMNYEPGGNMSMYNWLEEQDIVNDKTFHKNKWHNFLRQGDAKDLAENWIDIYNKPYSGPLDAKSIYKWIGEQKDRIQKTYYIDVEGCRLDEGLDF